MSFRKWLLKWLGCETNYYFDLYNAECVKNADLTAEISTLNDKIKNLEGQLSNGDDVAKPSWLDDSQYPYKPFISIEEGKFTLDDPRAIFCSKNYIIQKTATDRKWRELPFESRVKAIWDFVIDWLDYQYDIYEDWSPSFFSYYRKWGDCEDSSLFFVDLCRAAGIRIDRIFLSCGWYTDSNGNRFGHAFPIVKLDDGKWYIYETTISSRAPSPKLFKGSNYDCSWGLMNEKWYGKLKEGNQI